MPAWHCGIVGLDLQASSGDAVDGACVHEYGIGVNIGPSITLQLRWNDTGMQFDCSLS